jgi:hypothetical protein
MLPHFGVATKLSLSLSLSLSLARARALSLSLTIEADHRAGERNEVFEFDALERVHYPVCKLQVVIADNQFSKVSALVYLLIYPSILTKSQCPSIVTNIY